MSKTQSVLGLIGGGMLLLSSVAHSALGWKSLSEQIAATNAPPDLVLGLKMGWMFGGAAMVILGVIIVSTFAKRLRGEHAPTFAALVTGIGYLAFGLWAAVSSQLDPFFLVFIVPGALLLASAAGRTA